MQGGSDRVLVLERAADTGVGIEAMLASAGYETRMAADHLTSLRIVAEWRPSAIVVDLRVPERQGYQLGAAMAQMPDAQDVPFIFVGEVPNLLKETTVVPVGLVPTPVDHDRLVAAVSRALRQEQVAR